MTPTWHHKACSLKTQDMVYCWKLSGVRGVYIVRYIPTLQSSKSQIVYLLIFKVKLDNLTFKKNVDYLHVSWIPVKIIFCIWPEGWDEIINPFKISISNANTTTRPSYRCSMLILFKKYCSMNFVDFDKYLTHSLNTAIQILWLKRMIICCKKNTQ